MIKPYRLGSALVQDQVVKIGDRVGYGSGEAKIIDFFSDGKVLLYADEVRPWHFSPSSINFSDVEYDLRILCLNSISEYFGQFYEDIYYDRNFVISFNVFLKTLTEAERSKITKTRENRIRISNSNYKAIDLGMPTGLKINSFKIFDSSEDILSDIERKYSESFAGLKK